MDSTAWVALAGIGGTLIAAVLAPLVAALMQRGSARQERLMQHRVDAYADLLRATARLADNAMTWASVPLADLKETDGDELDRLISKARLVASQRVRGHLDDRSRTAGEFNRDLFAAKDHHRVDPLGATSIQQRMDLGTIAERLVELHRAIEADARSDLGA